MSEKQVLEEFMPWSQSENELGVGLNKAWERGWRKIQKFVNVPLCFKHPRVNFCKINFSKHLVGSQMEK